ncbi:secondary thiamine-phosphate synthase enzyme YjbQ [Methanococcus maripaludis]|uniref:Secondary thiamine-phosphate synthase enzyme n=2 Tax=Methanococcus maripaludis TaxID=39152 RepID=A0A7J9PGD1_METMI|nr:secondary thiamine-phosphate synthase enzyme YjbQ [Methanococcus maripaludis]MBA2862161.1 secondary thiamine-phosphate synthase enzyme [Methanococcus maripaludis]
MFFEYSVKTDGRESLVDISDNILDAVQNSKVQSGIAIVFTPHTTSAITINENADPSVKKDIIKFLHEKIPENYGFSHNEGNSDAHLKSSFFGPSLTLIINNGKVILGTWQGVYFCEFDGPRSRKFYVKIMKD